MRLDPLRPILLTTEQRIDPLGLDEAQPHLGWAVEGEGRDRRQTAFEIRVATAPSALAGTEGLIWHVGPIQSAATRHHAYAGVPLEPRRRYFWSVRVWDEAERVSGFAAPAAFETGLLGGPWEAAWITGPPTPRRLFPPAPDRRYVNRNRARAVAHLRRCFRVDGRIVRAHLYATALGVYAARLNGVAIGDQRLAPGWTAYAKRLDYQVYDVTELLHRGDNVLAALLGEGWYSGYLGFYPHRPRHIYGKEPQFSARLVIDLADGTTMTIATDGTWRTARGPRIASDLLKGEIYDARLSLPGWDARGFDDAEWSSAGTGSGPGTVAVLAASRAPPVRVTRTLAPIGLSRAPDGTVVVDMGQNMVGRVRIALPALPPGHVVTLRHAEMLTPAGALYRANLRTAAAEDRYVSAGPAETWTPLFTVHGFRYVGIAGLDEAPALDTITGEVIGSDLDETAEWETSVPALDRLRANILWSQRGNFLSIPTDCPQRDERLGWLADVAVFLPTAAYAMDVQSFMAKWMDDVIDAQSSEGAFPDVAPRGPHGPDGGPAWGDAGVIVPVMLFRRYGDRRLLARHYPAMRAWIDFVTRHNPDLIRTRKCGWNFGDWLSAGETTPKPLVATAYHAWIAALMAEAGEALGRVEEAAADRALFVRIRAAFQARFLTPGGRLEGDSQTAYLLALSMDLLPEEQMAAAVRHLVANIERRGTRLATGFLGVRLLLPVLTRHGHAELAYRLLLNDTCPSWLYPVKQGATTVWERWDGWTAEKGFQSARMNSFNHYALGSVGEWMMADMAGLADNGSAFARLRIAPVPGPGVARCRAAYRSPHGWVRSAWRQAIDRTRFEVTLPANTAGTVLLPYPEGARLLRDGRPAESDRILRHNGTRCAALEIGSGAYGFDVLVGSEPSA